MNAGGSYCKGGSLLEQIKRVIALGFFDGVHIGHGALLRRTAERARELGCASAAFTFDRAPKEFVTGVPVPLLTSPQERSELIRELYGIDEVIVAPFDREMMTMLWRDFIETLLLQKYGAVHLVAGHDYHFGFKNQGSPEILQDYCAAHGIGCDIIPKVEYQGITVSSTHIRSLVEAGEVERAAEFLGHFHRMTGTVEHGFGVGTARLFPTVNLIPHGTTIVPAHGVYATRVRLENGTNYLGVTNVGTRPTVGTGDGVTVETNLIDFAGDLYGQHICVDFCARLRDECKFDSTRALHDQIAQDIARAKELLK